MAAVITSITGLQNLINLQSFNASGNSLITIDLSGLTNLTYVDLRYNNIISVDNITWPSGLQVLGLSGNQIVTFNPSIALPNSLQQLDLSENQIVSFNPLIPLPNGLTELYLSYNQIVTFDPTIALPSSLITLGLSYNQIVTFNPSVALPSLVTGLDLVTNQMTTAGYTASEPWANAMSVIPSRGGIFIFSNIDSISGTNLETILTAKGWIVYS